MDKTKIRQFRSVLAVADVPLSPDDPQYVPGLHGVDAEDVIQELQDDILSRPPRGSALFYFTGQRGTGKSTELRRLQTLLAGEGAEVLLFDSLDYITETERISIETLLLLLTAALAAAAEAQHGQAFLSDGAWTRFGDWLKSDVQLSEVSVGGLKLAIRQRPASIAESIKRLSSPLEWINKVREFAADIVAFIRTRNHRERVVLIVDSLERLRAGPEQAQDEHFQQVLATFGGEMERLSVPGATVVYSTPPYLPLLADIRNYVSWYALASVRVYAKPIDREGRWTPQRRQPRPEGLEKMRGLVERRFAEWREVLQPEALDELALASGGDLRHFMQRLVSTTAGKAQYALDRLPLAKTDPLIEQVLDISRGETERLAVQEEWPMLQEIARTHNAIAKDRQDALRSMAHLFETRVILNYRNGAEWFDIHPLLWPLIDKQPDGDHNPAAPAAA